MIKAVIFDVGGVLHSNEDNFIVKNITTTLGITLNDFRQAAKKYIPLLQTGKINEKKFWVLFTKEACVPNTIPKYSLWAKVYLLRYKVNYGVIDIAKQLKNKGLQTAILSNSIYVHAQINKKHGIYKPFNTVVLSHEVGIRKPNPKIFQLVLKKLNRQATETVFIDNQKNNIKVAKQFGFKTILFKNEKLLKKELKDLGIF